MKPSSQLLVAVRLLNTVDNFSAQLGIYSEAGRTQLFCSGERIVLVEFGEHFPASWLTKMMMEEVSSRMRLASTSAEKVEAFRSITDHPEMLRVYKDVVKKHLAGIFASPLKKCEMKSDHFSGAATVLTVAEMLTECAATFLQNLQVDELIPNNEVSFCVTPDYVEKSTRLKISLQEGYLLSRLDRELALKEIIPTVPSDEMTVKRSLLLLWAFGVLNSPFMNQYVPKVEKAKAGQPASAAPLSSSSEKQNEATKEQIEMIEQTYRGLASKDFYTLLGVLQKADLVEIKAAYYRLARRFHPDRYYGIEDAYLKEKVDIIFSAINVAYETLKNSKSRQQYDRAPVEDKRVTVTSVSPETKSSGRTSAGKVAEDYFQRAQKAYSSRNYYEAVQYMRSATQIAPDNARYWRQLGIALTKNEQWRKEAEDSFQRAIEIEPINPENHLFLAYLYKGSGLRLRAKKCFQTVVEIDPKNEMALTELREMDEVDHSPQQKKGGLLGGIFKKK